MNLPRWMNLNLQLKVCLMVLALWQRGCHPWTNLVGTSSRIQKTTRLYYSENITSGIFASSPKNRTFSMENYSFTQHQLDGKEKRKPLVRPSSATTVFSPPPSQAVSATAEKESVQHAMDQVHAILDLYELTPSMSSDIVTSTLDGLIGKVFQDRTHTVGEGQVLVDLEALVWRCGELQIPLGTIMSLKMLTTMQKQAYETDQTEDSSLHFVERASKLLLMYCQGVLEESKPGSFRWPNEDIRGIFRVALSNKAAMTPSLWNLYRHIQNHHPDEDTAQEVQTTTLHVLSASGPIWLERQFQILVDLEETYRTTNKTIYNVDTDTLNVALQSASRHGDPQQATWLFRRLYTEHQPPADSQKKELWYLLMQAYSHSNQTGSIPYMERLIDSQPETQHTDLYNLVLKARVQQRTPGSGLYAEDFLRKMEELARRLDQPASVYPNMETAYLAVSAYLEEEPPLFQKIVEADALLRRLCAMYDLNDDHHKGPVSVFEKVLNAYATLPSQPKERKVVDAAESLLQFFLLQHRDGKIQEVPSVNHLGYILTVLNRTPNKYTAERSVEFFRLFEKLGSNTTLSILETLLDTLAKSGQTGHSNFAHELLQRASLMKAGKKEQGMELIRESVTNCGQN